MTGFRPRRPSPAFVVASIALFVALGGSAYAAFSVPTNSVGTKQLKNGAVTTKKLANGAVTTKKLANGAVTGAKLNLAGITVPNARRADSAINASNAVNASNASKLGGSPPSAFEPAANILRAVITNSAGTVNVVRGTPGVTAMSLAAGAVTVSFPRDVSNCAWIATTGNPANNPVGARIAAVRGSPVGSSDVEVVTFDTSGAQVDTNFHLAVFC